MEPAGDSVAAFMIHSGIRTGTEAGVAAGALALAGATPGDGEPVGAGTTAGAAGHAGTEDGTILTPIGPDITMVTSTATATLGTETTEFTRA